MTEEKRRAMGRQQAIVLLREALDRLERPSQNANGGSIMMGGVYWRLETVLREYADKELDAHEGADHAAFIRGNTPVTPPAVVAALEAERDRLKRACSAMNENICQTLGAALGYPWHKDDQTNFPGATEADGVCVGDHVAESIAAEAAAKLATVAALVEALEGLDHYSLVVTSATREAGSSHHDAICKAFLTARAALAAYREAGR